MTAAFLAVALSVVGVVLSVGTGLLLAGRDTRPLLGDWWLSQLAVVIGYVLGSACFIAAIVAHHRQLC